MARVKRLLRSWAALSFLLPQAGALLHAAEAFEACRSCDEHAGQPRLECADTECGRGDHHHHHHHHPGTCRACTAIGPALVEAPAGVDAAVSAPCLPQDSQDPFVVAVLLCRTIRGPPAPAGSAV